MKERNTRWAFRDNAGDNMEEKGTDGLGRLQKSGGRH